MHSGSFIASTSQMSQLDDFRRDVREKVYSRFETQKTVLNSAKDTQASMMQSILRRSMSPKSPRANPIQHLINKEQQSPMLIQNYTKLSPSRQSFKRSSLDLGKSSINSNILSYQRKNLQEVIPINRIIDMQKLFKTANYQANDSYMNELKKLARLVLNE